MYRPILVLLLTAFVSEIVVLGTGGVWGQTPEKPRPGFLFVLKLGQSVTLKEASGRYEISTFEDGPEVLGHKVTEIGAEYLSVEDVAGVTETRIPIYSIKAIVRLKVPRK